MPNEQKKSNDINGLEKCPRGTDVGPLGRAERLVDNFVAGWIYAAAVEELLQRTEEIDRLLEATTAEEDSPEMVEIKKQLMDIDEKWVLAAAMFGVEA